MADPKPKADMFGWLSYHHWTAQEEVDWATKFSSYPVKPAKETSPKVNLILNQRQLGLLEEFIKTELIPFFVAQPSSSKDHLTTAQAKQLIEDLNKDLPDRVLNIPIKAPTDKVLAERPNAAATVRINGPIGGSWHLAARVTDESQLNHVGPSDVVPAVYPLKDTNLDIYSGAFVAVTYQGYPFVTSRFPGLNLKADMISFQADAPRIGGGGAVAANTDVFLADDGQDNVV